MKKIWNASMLYLLLAMAGGVFYREFSKFHGYTGKTTLAYVHVHFLVLGMFLFLLTALFASQKPELLHNKLFQRFFALYNIALPFMVTTMLVRGPLQVLQTELTKASNAMISGFAGISHILMAVSLVMYLLALKKTYIADKK